MTLERSERNILGILQKDGRISNVDLARQAGLSESPCLRRVKQLESAGFIKGYVAVIDPKLVGFDVCAYIQLNLADHSDEIIEAFHQAIEREERIIECYALSGTYDYLLKVVARNIDDFADLTMKRILRLPAVKDVISSFILQGIKTRGALPV